MRLTRLGPLFGLFTLSIFVSGAMACGQSGKQLVQPGSEEKIFSISLNGGDIFYGARLLKIGDSIKIWVETIGGSPRCTNKTQTPMFCVWDQLGLEISSDQSKKSVSNFYIYVNPERPDVVERITGLEPDGRPSAINDAFRPPISAFTGRLRLDDFEIVSNTPFREILRHSLPTRRLYCGRDCHAPMGIFNDTTKIYFRLLGSDDGSFVESIAIGR